MLVLLRNTKILMRILDRKSGTQLHRAGLRPRVSSLMTSLEGTMVLNAEL